jgi:hypothetical protein
METKAPTAEYTRLGSVRHATRWPDLRAHNGAGMVQGGHLCAQCVPTLSSTTAQVSAATLHQ